MTLAKAVREVVDQEANRLGLKVKTMEGTGLQLKRSVVTKDLSEGSPAHRESAHCASQGRARTDYTIIAAGQFIGGTVNYAWRA